MDIEKLGFRKSGYNVLVNKSESRSSNSSPSPTKSSKSQSRSPSRHSPRSPSRHSPRRSHSSEESPTNNSKVLLKVIRDDEGNISSFIFTNNNGETIKELSAFEIKKCKLFYGTHIFSFGKVSNDDNTEIIKIELLTPRLNENNYLNLAKYINSIGEKSFFNIQNTPFNIFIKTDRYDNLQISDIKIPISNTYFQMNTPDKRNPTLVHLLSRDKESPNVALVFGNEIIKDFGKNSGFELAPDGSGSYKSVSVQQGRMRGGARTKRSKMNKAKTWKKPRTKMARK